MPRLCFTAYCISNIASLKYVIRMLDTVLCKFELSSNFRRIVKKVNHLASKLGETEGLKTSSSSQIFQDHKLWTTRQKTFFSAINGDIFKNCVGERKTFSEDESKTLTRQLAAALDFIHKRYIVHLDVKPQNILLAQGQFPFHSITYIT